jgi:cell division protein FtsL
LITNKKKFFIEILKGILKLIIAGIFIGYLKEYDFWIALILVAKILNNIYKDLIKQKKKNWLLLIGMFLTCFGGLVGETWGVANGYWEYHAVERELPLWLPFAWMYAFYFLYKLELKLIPLLKNQSHQNKIFLALLLALILPAFGEVITIHLGVWTYYWPYQLFGVPLYAFICLVFVHMLVYTILHFICRKYTIEDVVFN